MTADAATADVAAPHTGSLARRMMLIAAGWVTILLLVGPDTIFGFTASMLLGIVIGTFSSFYISAPVLIWLNVTPDSFVQAENPKSGAERIGESFPGQR